MMTEFEEKNKDEIRTLPKITFKGEIIVVRNSKDEKKALNYLSKQKVIGFDTETKPSFKKGKPNANKVALLQLATREKAYLFRLNKDKPDKAVIDLLSNDEIIKAGAAIRDDIKTLQTIYKFKAGSFVDIQDMAEKAGLNVKSLRKLTAMIFSKRLSKSQRLSNWEAESFFSMMSIDVERKSSAFFPLRVTLQPIGSCFLMPKEGMVLLE